MRSYPRRHARQSRTDNNSYWLSFSDLMSAVLLVFILVMFYIVYTYFDMLEISTAEIFQKTQALQAQEAALQAQETALDQKDEELTLKDQQLQASTEKLTQTEREMIRQQAELLASQDELEKNRALLAEREAEMEAIRAQLDAQQTQLIEQQTLLGSQQTLMNQQQEKLDVLVGVRARIIESLAAALAGANIRATVDASSGAITLDSSVLFDTAQSELKESGKLVLDRFLPVYLEVLMSEENSENISEIIIEGHTDTVGGYMSNLQLSQRRALAVMQYILDDDYDKISAGMKERLRQIATANGRSYSHPVYAADGSIDMDASRRVEFKFRLQDEQMIESMRQLLESME